MSALHERALPAVAPVIAAAVWAASLSHGFVYDDFSFILGNPWVRDPGSLWAVFTSSTTGFDQLRGPSNTYRPLLYALYMAEYLAFGFKPFWFHLVNLLAHAANALLVFLVASFMLKGLKGGAYGAFFAALLFGVHTVNAEAVNWVSASTDLFCTLFVLSGLYVYIRGAEGWRSIVAAAFTVAAMLFKETGAALPVLAFAYDLSAGRVRLKWRGYAAFLAAGLVYAGARFNAIGGVMHHQQAALAPVESALTAAHLLKEYLLKLVYPVDLSAIYEFRPVRVATDRRFISGAVIAALYVAAAFWGRKRPRALLPLALVLVPLLPVLYVPALSSSAFAERYLYLPSSGLALLAGCGLSLLMNAPAAVRAAACAAAAALILAFSAASVQRSTVWASDYTLWADAVKKAPLNANAHYNYAWASHGRGDTRTAAVHYRETIRLDKGSADAHYNLGVIYMRESMVDEAEAEFRAALAINPAYPGARGMLENVTRLKGGA